MTIVLRPGQSADDLAARGNRACPACGGSLARWGQARTRVLRSPDGERRLCPPRVRCRACGVTHVVLPPDTLVRRRDAVTTVGVAWRGFVAGGSARRLARDLGIPMETVRGWIRRLSALLRSRHGGPPGTDRERLGLALDWVTTEAGVAGCRDEVDLWRFVAFRSQGLLLFNTNWP